MRSITYSLVALAISCTFSIARDGELPPPKDEPKVINPGPPPSDAIVLFDGKNLSQWQSAKEGACQVGDQGWIRRGEWHRKYPDQKAIWRLSVARGVGLPGPGQRRGAGKR